MKNIMKRSLALVMALFMFLSLLPVSHVHAESSDFYTYSSDGKYIYNWGTRGEVATYLSPNAESFYTGDKAYDVLSANPGGEGTSGAPGSALFSALQSVMANAHSHKTTYAETTDLYQYTDCQQSGTWSNGQISSFYSGKAIGPAWDSGATWNREHTWPNSKGAAGDDENDIMMLRPTSTSENSSRGNTAYGQSAGYFHPNADSGYTLDQRGDVARIFLYTYCRWGITNGNGSYDTWGSNGVMESLEVLLTWMEEDPVDTWELGRNDAVQAITGTRNVFVDYPEYAFLLFGAEIPAGMITPSGAGAGNACSHNFVAGEPVAPTCTAEGYTLYTCSLCGVSYKSDKQPVTDHTYVDGSCSVCGAKEPVELVVIDEPAAGVAYKFGMYHENTSIPAVYYLAGGKSSYYLATTTDQTAAIDVYLEAVEGGYHLYTEIDGVKTYINMVVSGTHVNGEYEASATANTVYTYVLDSKTLVATVNGGDYWFGARNDMQYTTVGAYDVTKGAFVCHFYGEAGSGAEATCTHTNTTVTGAVEATCTTAGNTGKVVCADCGATVTLGQVIPAKGHNYENGACTVCGEAAPAGLPKEGVAYKFGMIQGNISETNIYYLNGAMVNTYYFGSTTDVNAAIDVYVEQTEGGYYLYTLVDGVKTYLNIVVSGSYVNGKYQTTASTVFTYDSANDILVTQVNGTAYCFGSYSTYDSISPVKVSDSSNFFCKLYAPCEHTNTTVEGAAEATCTEPGHTGKTVCGDCGRTVDAGTVIDALGHNYVDGVCTRCGLAESEAPAEPVTAEFTLSFADKANRTVFTTSQQVWEQNGVKLTNDKASSSSNVADYANPARFYASSKITIECQGMTKIVFNVNSGKPVSGLTNSLASISGITVTTSGNIVTVEFDEMCNSFVIPKLTAQIRLNGLTVTACTHANTTVEGAVEATCTEPGHTGKTTCDDCGFVDEGSVIDALGHDYVDGICSRCSQINPELLPKEGIAYKFGMIQANITDAAVYYLNGAMKNTYYFGTTTDESQAIDVYVEETEGGYYLYTELNGVKNYLNMVVSGTHINAKYQTTASTVYTYDLAKDAMVTQIDGTAYCFGSYSTYDTVSPIKASSNDFRCKLYPPCEHANTTVKDAAEATCTEPGHTGKTFCDDCGRPTDAGQVIDALGHDYVDGVCTRCGQEEAEVVETEEVTLSFATKSNRTVFTTSQQVWEQNGAKLTNDKASSTSNVADYANPARFYKNSKITVEYPAMLSIAFTCSSSSYATALKTSIGTMTDVTVSVSGSVVTVTFAEPRDSFVIAALSGGQVRMNSLTITAVKKTPASGDINGVAFYGDNEGVSLELHNVLAYESVAVKVYSDETLLTTVSLRDIEDAKQFLGSLQDALTVSIRTYGESTHWVATEWKPMDNVVPTKYELYIDGQLMDTHEETVDVAAWNALKGTDCDHNYESVVTAPTCTEPGYTTHTCSVCGDSYTDTEVAALNHDWSDWAVVKESTLTVQGQKERHCLRENCDCKETEDIPVLEPLATPAITKRENTAEGIKLTWGAVEGAERYRVYVKVNGVWKALGTTTGTSYVYTGAVSGETYTFTIRCVNDENTICTSYYKNAGWKKTYIAQPVISKLKNTADGIQITWDAVPGAARYRVYVKENGTWKALDSTTETSFLWTGAVSGETYTFTIRCVDADNAYSTSSYNKTGWKKTYIAEPAITGMESTVDGIKFTWDAVPGAARYRVYVASEYTWKALGSTDGTSFTWTGAEAGKSYTFTIRCVNAENEYCTSSYNTIGWTYKYYPTPEITELKATDEGIQITWGALNGAERYRIYVKNGNSWKILGTPTENAFLWTDAEAGKTYTFTVRSVDAENTYCTSNYNATGWTIEYK